MKDAVQEILQNAGKIIMKYFSEQLEVNEKTSASDIQTEADTKSEEYIINALEKFYPTYNILAEESGNKDKGNDSTFFIDPIEGSSNFVTGIPLFVTCLGLIEKNTIKMGAVYNPVTKDLYYAESENGAYLNDKKITVNSVTNIEKATIDRNFSYNNTQKEIKSINEKLDRINFKRNLDIWCGGLSYCLLASGKIEAILCNKDNLYDFIAPKLIAKEAGAKITDFEGNPETNIRNNIFIASNGTQIHNRLTEALSGIYSVNNSS